MKKIVSIIMAVCLSITALPVIAISANITPEISLDEFISQLSVLQKQHDEAYIGELAFEDGSEFYHVDGFDAIQLDLYLNGVTDIHGKQNRITVTHLL